MTGLVTTPSTAPTPPEPSPSPAGVGCGPWPREERLRVLSAMGHDLTPGEWAERMGVHAQTVRADLRACGHDDTVTIVRELMARCGLRIRDVAAIAMVQPDDVKGWLFRGQAPEPRHLRKLCDTCGYELVRRYECRPLTGGHHEDA